MKRLQLGFVLAALASLLGCKTSSRAPGAVDDYYGATPTCIDHDGDGFGLNCPLGADCDDSNATVTIGCYVCDHPSPGCPCSSENARSRCGTMTAQEGTQVTCSYGESVCTGGTWGACTADGKTIKTFDSARRTLGLAAAVPCGIACDPYCQQWPDTPDNSLSTPQGLLGTDAGLTLEQADARTRPYLPNGPMPPNIQDTLADGGVFPDVQPDAIVYHELPPTVTAQDPVTTTTVVPPPSIDVYFLENNAGTMLEANQTLHTEVPAAATGTMDRVKAVVPDARFGVGRFMQYDWPQWNDTGGPTVAFEHVLTPLADNTAVATALQYTVTHNVEAPAMPRPWMQALYAVATTGGLPGPTAPWAPPRAIWSSPPASGATEAGACPAGTTGYPCFRPVAIPVTVVVTDTPSANGPGGQYAYARGPWTASGGISGTGIPGAKLWTSATPVAVPGGHNTEATAYPIDPNTFAIYTGNTNTQGAINASWGAPTDIHRCNYDRASTARNVFFTFTVPAGQRQWYHFDPIGSTMTGGTNTAVLYLYRKTGAVIDWIDCNEYNNFDDVDRQQLPLSLDGVVDAGTYYLVVDGNSGAEGPYVLHVNAMPDGAGGAAVTEPNYNEALAAYNGIGGKVIGIDGSGYSCDNSAHASYLTKNTANSLEKLLLDTGSLDGGGNPYLRYLDNSGLICHAGDLPIGQQLADAILGVTDTFRSTPLRATITAVAVDTDDAVDFDGPPGGPNQLTPMNVNDATFVTSITTVSTAPAMANCTQIQANQFVGCTNATAVTFMVNIQTPANIPLVYHDQIFTFVVRVMSNLPIPNTVLSETPFVVVVPALWPYLGDAWFVRDFDTTSVCPMGTAPVWGTWAWNATTPGDSRIDFDVSVAPIVTDLSTMAAFVGPLQFSNTPAALVGTAIGVRDDTATGGPDTQLGATVVDATLAANMKPRDSRTLRIRSHLVPTSDSQFPPTLNNWNLSVSCVPAE